MVSALLGRLVWLESWKNRTCIGPERQLIFGSIGQPAAAARLNLIVVVYTLN